MPDTSTALKPGRCRVLLVDDHELVRMGFRLLLESADDVEVVGEVGSGEQALAWLRERLGPALDGPAQAAPDVVVMDVAMPGITGIEATRQLLARLPALKVLALSAHEDASHVRHLMRAGGRGYLSKRSPPQALLEAVRQVARGQRYLDPALAQAVALDELPGGLHAPRAHAPSGSPRPAAVAALSEREFEVFLQLARGASVADIAAQLHISPRTVGTHLYHVKQKTGCRNQAEITLLALQQGLLAP
ncbi:MAG: Response regulator UvrY [Paracidovorax wautersii]|uniref:Response regulator UvrY n=1 Tax=Paracidovorax wautersii TaxID=1177982 RepID=A0A7V8FQS8_9BURK|nr:MAG: Response regulator UvrY [Paracidovorax wautersii]